MTSDEMPKSSAPSILPPRPTAAALGYHMPAEFEPVEAVWLTYPHNPDTWPLCLDEVRRQFDAVIAAVQRFAKPRVIGPGDERFDWRTDDSWIRDYGPVFVVKGQGQRAEGQGESSAAPLACHDFIFNCWGDKYEPYEHDDVVPRHIAAHLDIPIWLHDFVLEGGSIDVNGRGTVMTTEQCLLNPNRNPRYTRQQIEQALHDALGTRHVIWLPGGIEGDDTDGHIDDVARFIAPGTVAAVRPDRSHPDHGVLENNWRALESARDQDGEPLRLIALPAPQPIHYDYPADQFGPGGRKPLPASHTNFLILNGGVLLPTFGQPSDDEAVRVLRAAMPEHEIVPVRCERLVVGLGGIHCLSCQQPKVE